jgi:hypothetical protein
MIHKISASEAHLAWVPTTFSCNGSAINWYSRHPITSSDITANVVVDEKVS